MIYLVRHGEAAASWGDHPDPGLSVLGHAQAQNVAEQLLGLNAQKLICSPMQRCQETAAPFAHELGHDLVIEQAVSEIQTPDHVEDRVSWLRNLMTGDWPAELRPWCQSAYDAVNALPDGTAVFSHFVAINAIVGTASGNQSVNVFRPDHCSITMLDRDAFGGLTVHKLGGDAITRIL